MSFLIIVKMMMNKMAKITTKKDGMKVKKTTVSKKNTKKIPARAPMVVARANTTKNISQIDLKWVTELAFEVGEFLIKKQSKI